MVRSVRHEKCLRGQAVEAMTSAVFVTRLGLLDKLVREQPRVLYFHLQVSVLWFWGLLIDYSAFLLSWDPVHLS